MTGYTVAAVGDVMLDRTVGKRFRSDPAAFRLTTIAELLKSHDIVFANLENPVAISGSPHRRQDPNVCFRATPSTLQVLDNLGVNAVSVGNNHLLDYGPTALGETLDRLTARGISWSGAGRTYEEANRPLELEVRGQRVAIFSRCFVFSASTERATRTRAGVADYKIGSLLRQVRTYRERGYDVHVSVHWGIEYKFRPIPYQMRWARRMIDAGATLVIGHGPHYPQGIEDYRSGRIVYSLGNFIFDEPMKFANRSFIFSTEVRTEGLREVHVHPVHLADGLPRLVHGRPRARLIRLIEAMSWRYQHMSSRERKKVNNLWFRDIIRRIETMGSVKFLRLPPVRFFFEVGAMNYLRKLLPRRLKTFVRD